MAFSFSRRKQVALSLYILLIIIPITAVSKPLTIRANPDYFPVTYLEDKTWKGMDIETIRAILLRADLDYRIISAPFHRSLIELKQGSIDLIPNLTKSSERSKAMNWIGPTRTTCIGLVVQEKDTNTSIETLDNLIHVANQRQLKIGYLSGASYSEQLDNLVKAVPKSFSILPSNDQHLEMLKLGRIFAYFFDAYEIQQRLRSSKHSSKYQGLALHSYYVKDSCIGAYMGVSKKLDNAIQRKLLDGFDSIKSDGTFTKIYDKWVDNSPLAK